MSPPTSVLDRLRAEWAKRYTDTLVATRVTDLGEPNAEGVHDTPTVAEIYNGPGLIRPEQGQEADGTDTEFGQQSIAVQGYRLTLPWDAALLDIGDTVTATASTDPALIGRPVTVRRLDRDSYLTHRRYMAHFDHGPGLVDT